MYEIRKTKACATCCGLRSDCNTYKDHPNWTKIRKAGKHIPVGEYALFVAGKKPYCICKKHAPEVLRRLKYEIAKAEELAAELKWTE